MNKTDKQTLDEKYFEQVYAASDDPWNFTTSAYEAEKYAATIAALPGEGYASAFEIGCSIGVLSEKLAAKCDKLLSVDISDKALAQARKRCENLPHVTFRKMNVPQEFPAEKFDLILVSEVGYYFAPPDWAQTMAKIFAHLNKDGQIALVHWLPAVHDYPQTGDEVHDSFAVFAQGGMQNRHTTRRENYRIDLWAKL